MIFENQKNKTMKLIGQRITLGSGKEIIKLSDGREIRSADHDNSATSLMAALAQVTGGVKGPHTDRSFDGFSGRFRQHANGWWVSTEIHSPIAIIGEL